MKNFLTTILFVMLASAAVDARAGILKGKVLDNGGGNRFPEL